MIAFRMAQRVVDRLKIIKVEHHERMSAIQPFSREKGFDVSFHRGAVE
ncbi:hypothetical protein SDC9_172182 [bioreactor metagenome]|uniref:Uncharacterized protein n=1 Tax=bioreactor metagenome TaxID=1076179 RepID=A0A645GFA2_9ZZZZ